MDQLITEVLKIDEIAQEKIALAKSENSKILKNIEKKKQDIIESIQNKANKKLSDVEKYEIEIFEKQVSMLEEKHKLDLKNLEKIYEENCNKWVKDIVSNTLSQ